METKNSSKRGNCGVEGRHNPAVRWVATSVRVRVRGGVREGDDIILLGVHLQGLVSNVWDGRHPPQVRELRRCAEGLAGEATLCRVHDRLLGSTVGASASPQEVPQGGLEVH